MSEINQQASQLLVQMKENPKNPIEPKTQNPVDWAL